MKLISSHMKSQKKNNNNKTTPTKQESKLFMRCCLFLFSLSSSFCAIHRHHYRLFVKQQRTNTHTFNLKHLNTISNSTHTIKTQ